MARNEEKQLARLNRFYLEKQKQEELKKRPPRPRLDSLNTAREIRKWLPTITTDIDFYIKQMEVPCYTDDKVTEFTDRIQQLKMEYRAYLHKLRTLEPDASASSWSRRPYARQKQPFESSVRVVAEMKDEDLPTEIPQLKDNNSANLSQGFVPISTPVLKNMAADISSLYGPPQAVLWNVNPETQDEPLQFGIPKLHPAIDEYPFNPVVQEEAAKVSSEDQKETSKEKGEELPLQDHIAPNSLQCRTVSGSTTKDCCISCADVKHSHFDDSGSLIVFLPSEFCACNHSKQDSRAFDLQQQKLCILNDPVVEQQSFSDVPVNNPRFLTVGSGSTNFLKLDYSDSSEDDQ